MARIAIGMSMTRRNQKRSLDCGNTQMMVATSIAIATTQRTQETMRNFVAFAFASGVGVHTGPSFSVAFAPRPFGVDSTLTTFFLPDSDTDSPRCWGRLARVSSKQILLHVCRIRGVALSARSGEAQQGSNTLDV